MAGDGTKSIWWNGELVPHGDARVHVLTHGLHYGTGVFEGVRAYMTPEGLAIFRLEEHIERLFRSVGSYKIEMSFTPTEILEGCLDVVRDNDLESCYLRPIAFVGLGPLGVYWRDRRGDDPGGARSGVDPNDLALGALGRWSGLRGIAAPCPRGSWPRARPASSGPSGRRDAA